MSLLRLALCAATFTFGGTLSADDTETTTPKRGVMYKSAPADSTGAGGGTASECQTLCGTISVGCTISKSYDKASNTTSCTVTCAYPNGQDIVAPC